MVQGGLWLLCAVFAWRAARMRQMAIHRDWMIRSYGFALVFIVSRIPDLIWDHYSDQFVSDFLWLLVVAALLAPDVVMLLSTTSRAPATRRQI